MLRQELSKNFAEVMQRVKDTCEHFQRNPEEVEMLPVSKLHSSEKIKILSEIGLQKFGENYPDELLSKAEALKDTSVQWSFIGQLQSNKIQRLMKVCSEIQTVSTLKHIKYIAHYAKELNLTKFPIYICLNSGNENQKAGFHWAELEDAISHVQQFPDQILLKGLMCIPPAEISMNASIHSIPDLYYRVAEESKKIGEGKLSMGMSNDLEASIGVGSTCVRIGTAILGERHF